MQFTDNAVSEKTMENVRKHKDIKLVTTEKWRDYLVSEPNYHAKKIIRKSVSDRNEKNTDTYE